MTTVAAVGAIAVSDDALLMIRRAHEPGAGLWSIPGGRVEVGESDAQALEREMVEETGLAVEVGELVGRVERPGPAGVRYEIRDYRVRVLGGRLRAGDDASQAAWVPWSRMATLATTEGLVETLRAWGVAPAEIF